MPKSKKKKIVTEFAKEKSKLWAPVVMHKVHNAYVYPQIVKTPDFCVFLHFLVPKNPTQGSKFSRKKKFFFLRFFDFLTRRCPIQNALVVQKMTGELTLDAQNSPILAFFDFLVPEGYLGCSEQASKTLVKKKKIGGSLKHVKKSQKSSKSVFYLCQN